METPTFLQVFYRLFFFFFFKLTFFYSSCPFSVGFFFSRLYVFIDIIVICIPHYVLAHLLCIIVLFSRDSSWFRVKKWKNNAKIGGQVLKWLILRIFICCKKINCPCLGHKNGLACYSNFSNIDVNLMQSSSNLFYYIVRW